MRQKIWSQVAATVALLLAGCASDIQTKVMCSTSDDCWRAAGTLYFDVDVDANADFLPKCCAGFCMVKSVGCDQGYRYLTRDPNNQPSGGYGECVPAPMCSMPDMLDAGTD